MKAAQDKQKSPKAKHHHKLVETQKNSTILTMPAAGQKAVQTPEMEDSSNAYEYDEDGKAVEPVKILAQNATTNATRQDPDTERERLEKHLSTISHLEDKLEKITANHTKESVPVQVQN